MFTALPSISMNIISNIPNRGVLKWCWLLLLLFFIFIFIFSLAIPTSEFFAFFLFSHSQQKKNCDFYLTCIGIPLILLLILSLFLFDLFSSMNLSDIILMCQACYFILFKDAICSKYLPTSLNLNKFTNIWLYNVFLPISDHNNIICVFSLNSSFVIRKTCKTFLIL